MNDAHDDAPRRIEADRETTPHPSAPAQAAPRRPLLARLVRSLSRSALSTKDGHQRQVRAAISLCEAVLSERGEVSGARLATEALTAYRALDDRGRDAFLGLLADSFLPHPDDVGLAADAYRSLPSPATLTRLQLAVESPRQELFRRLNLARGGTSALIEIRRHLRRTLQQHPERAGIDADLAHLFRSWFNGGFLNLHRIDWRTSALILERLIEFEAVHQIQGWTDLHRRLEQDRRCYAFFHPALPDDPLIFIEVALTGSMSADVQPLLDPHSAVVDPASASCAIFYSITNCQEGLHGVSFGNLLIKQVVEDLERNLPRLRTFATLSPLPGFRTWLMSQIPDPSSVRMSASLKELLTGLVRQPAASDRTLAPHRDELLRLCAHYLLEAKQDRAPLDAVARFHLANGARLERINWAADTSDLGMRRSLGLMVNYVYQMDELEENHEAYARERKIACARQVRRLAKPLASTRQQSSRPKA